MNNIYCCFIYLVITLTTPTVLTAKHLIGGEISYKCLGNGDYEITLKVYRDCLTDGADFDREANFSIFQCDGTIDCTDLEQGNQGFKFTVPLDTVETINYPDPTCELPQICVELGIYRFRLSEFESFLPNTDNSYHIVHQRCCRNGSVTNIETPGEFGNTFTIAITPAAQELCNTSPTFNNFPPVITCINDLFEFQQLATDEEGDSLVYSFSAPLHGGGDDVSGENYKSCVGVIPDPPCPPPYTKVPFIQPLYDAAFPFGNFDQTIEIKPSTGLITGTPTLLGQFVVGLSVKEYRNGILLSTTQREFQINVINCADNNDRIGSACDDGNPNTEKDKIQEDCSCRGLLTAAAKNEKDVFISEYIESNNSTMCIEIYNPTDQIITAFDLYEFRIYNEANQEGITLHTINKSILPHSTYLLCHEASDTALLNMADATFSIDIDGNEAISIENRGTLIDLFGNRNCFPENFWRGGSLGNRSADKVLVRCPCIRNGIKSDPIDCEFPSLSEEWIGFQPTDLQFLGTHDTIAEEGSILAITAGRYCACEQSCRERDSLALLSLYNTTNGENWTTTWDLAQPIDTWFGVILNEEGCVICLDLDGLPDCSVPFDTDTLGNNLVGYIPDQIEGLENLEALYLSHNSLSGVIPRSISNLTRLKNIWLNDNDLSGEFPVGLILLDSLQQVVLHANQLTGNLPPEMADLEQLAYFIASENQLTGCFPDSYLDLCSINIEFVDNPSLPWKGDFTAFCEGNIPQPGATCDDNNEATSLDVIQVDCSCKGEKNIEILSFSTPCRDIKLGEEHCIPFQVNNFTDLRGIQMAIDWEASVLAFTELQISENLVSLSESSFNQEQVTDGQLQLLWADENSILGNDLLDGDTLFKICFIRQQLGPASISINEEGKVPFPSMALTVDLDPVPIDGTICPPTDGTCATINFLGEQKDTQLIELCGSTLELSVDLVPGKYTGHWISSNPFISIPNPQDTQITITQIPPGSTTFSWVVDTLDCTSYYQESFKVVSLFRPVLERDTIIITDKESSFNFSINSNQYATNLTSDILTSPSHGELRELAIGQFELQPSNSLTNFDEFVYEICYEDCAAICGSTTIVFQLKEATVIPSSDETLLPNTITPNGDGLNDALVFPQLLDPLAFPDNELLVFNRWGDVVFLARPYDNSWEGTDKNEAALVEGTYYYILRLEVGRGNVLRGKITVLR